MSIAKYFPIWHKLNDTERSLLNNSASKRSVPKGTILHSGDSDCVGLLVIRSGQLRAFILSDEGKEITIHRLFERDICLFSASCIMSSVQFDITVEAEKESDLWIIPTEVYRGLLENSAVIANYTNQIMASRFSDVMWLIEQIMWKSFDKRLSGFLLEESILEDTDKLKITQVKIAIHVGTAREVVTRMRRYFKSEGMVSLSRGVIQLTDRENLKSLSK